MLQQQQQQQIRRKKHSQEFKREAVRLITERGLTIAQASRDLGVNQNMLGRWKQQLSVQEEQVVSGHGQFRDMELVRLQREVDVLREERDILKKAVGIFSRP
jgi:transposase